MEPAALPRALRVDLVVILGQHGLLEAERGRFQVRLVVVRLVAGAGLLALLDVLRARGMCLLMTITLGVVSLVRVSV